MVAGGLNKRDVTGHVTGNNMNYHDLDNAVCFGPNGLIRTVRLNVDRTAGKLNSSFRASFNRKRGWCQDEIDTGG